MTRYTNRMGMGGECKKKKLMDAQLTSNQKANAMIKTLPVSKYLELHSVVLHEIFLKSLKMLILKSCLPFDWPKVFFFLLQKAGQTVFGQEKI